MYEGSDRGRYTKQLMQLNAAFWEEPAIVTFWSTAFAATAFDQLQPSTNISAPPEQCPDVMSDISILQHVTQSQCQGANHNTSCVEGPQLLHFRLTRNVEISLGDDLIMTCNW